MALGGSGRKVAVVDLKTGQTVRKVNGESYITSITFSPDNQYLFTGSLKNEILKWRLKDGRLIRRLTGSNGEITDTEITPDGNTLLSTAADGALRFWQVSTGKLIMTAFIINPPALGTKARQATGRKDYDWVVVAPDGRFDTNNLEESKRLHWIVEDDPLHPLPLEIFMRDYYEPRLLARLLAGEQLKPVRKLSDLNLAQPLVKIVKTEPGPAPEVAAVTVEVNGAQRTYARNGQDVVMQTGVHDLRLYRDGQLVGQWPEPGDKTFKSLDLNSEAELKEWQQATEVKLDDQGRGTKTFTVRLPRRGGLAALTISS